MPTWGQEQSPNSRHVGRVPLGQRHAHVSVPCTDIGSQDGVSNPSGLEFSSLGNRNVLIPVDPSPRLGCDQSKSRRQYREANPPSKPNRVLNQPGGKFSGPPATLGCATRPPLLTTSSVSVDREVNRPPSCGFSCRVGCLDFQPVGTFRQFLNIDLSSDGNDRIAYFRIRGSTYRLSCLHNAGS